MMSFQMSVYFVTTSSVLLLLDFYCTVFWLLTLTIQNQAVFIQHLTIRALTCTQYSLTRYNIYMNLMNSFGNTNCNASTKNKEPRLVDSKA